MFLALRVLVCVLRLDVNVASGAAEAEAPEIRGDHSLEGGAKFGVGLMQGSGNGSL